MSLTFWEQWEQYEEEAIRIGCYSTYWDETPRVFEKRARVYKEMEEQRRKEIDAYCYNLGIYIGYAVNSPKKYPKKPFLEKENKEISWQKHKEMMKMLSEVSKIRREKQ